MAYEHGIELDFSRPGTPTNNAKVGSLKGRFRQEWLNAPTDDTTKPEISTADRY